MSFTEFSAMFSSMYREARGQTPFAITIRRTFNRLRHLDSVTIASTLQEELAS